MILFSDAVFAIVITLMAIEIRVPDFDRSEGASIASHLLIRIIPTFVAYAISFCFIGMTWYQHLQLFSLLKDFDKGLVIRNLIMLFFIGLFPFSATLMIRLGNDFVSSWVIYFLVIFLSKSAQLFLQHYILFVRPSLRLNTDIYEEEIRFKKSRISIIMLLIIFTLVIVTYALVSDENKSYSWLWVIALPVTIRILRKRIK